MSTERCYCNGDCSCFRFGIHDYHHPEDCKMVDEEKCEHGYGIKQGPCPTCDAPQQVKDLREFMAWFKDQCWPIEPKEAKGAFDREETIDNLILYYVVMKDVGGHDKSN